MIQLDEQELRCLKAIANGSSIIVLHCKAPVLEKLIGLGLVEQTPGRRLPMEMVRLVYRLTAAGQSMLSL